MITIKFFLLDVNYKIVDGTSLIYLYGKTAAGERICVVEKFEPYLYVEASEDSALLKKQIEGLQIEGIKVTGTEEVERNHLNRKLKLIKICTNVPEGKNKIRKLLEDEGFRCFEYDLSAVFQYLRDKDMTPLSLVEAQGEYQEVKSKVPVFFAEQLGPADSEMLANPRILSFDIETYAKERAIIPEKNPVLMLAFYGGTEEQPFRKVITWKRFKTDLDYIEFVESEEALIKKFKEFIKNYQPDILTGYFSDGFDFPYLQSRAKIYNIKLDLGLDYSELEISKRDGSTSSITGIVHVDVYKFVKNVIGRGMDIESLSLNSVSKELLGYNKHDVNLDNLAEIWDERPEDLEEFCKYNLHDAFLNYELCVKLMPSLQELVKLIGLPLFEINRMSFSRLVENYILKRSREFNVLAANKPDYHELEWRRNQTYKGGFVYEPKPGIYQNLAVFDFRSLYPSIIASHNIGPDTLNCECCKDTEKVPGSQNWFCKKKKSFFSGIVEDLILRRMRIKEMIKAKKKQDTALLEARSYGLKTVANSFYGYMGFFAARWYCLECVQSITAYARNYIQTTMQKAEEEGFTVVYGDSLPPERKIFVLTPENEIQLVSIGKFVDENLNNEKINAYRTLAYDGEKLIFSPLKKVIRHDYDSKEKGKLLEFITTHGKTVVTPQHSVYGFDDKPVLKDAGSLAIEDKLISLTNVPKIEKYREGYIFDLDKLWLGDYEEEICFYTDNYRFSNGKGNCPYCNKEVLSLSSHVYSRHKERKTFGKIGESYVWVGTKKNCRAKVPRLWKLTAELAWILGYYCADGSVSDCMTKTNRKCILSFGGQDIKKIERVKFFFDSILNDDLKIIKSLDKRTNKEMYYYRVQRVAIVALFQFGFGCGKGSSGKMVPEFVYTSEEKIRRSFLEGYLAGDGHLEKDDRYKTRLIRFDTNSKDLACGLQFLFKSLEHGKSYLGKNIEHMGWKYRKDKEKISSLRLQTARKKECLNYSPARIKEINEKEYFGPVYDLEVEGTHNFVDAEGLLLVHNTDSLMAVLGEKSREEALAFMEEVNGTLSEFMELEFEGFYPRSIFVAVKGGEYGAKKKYALFDGEKIKVVGFEAVRRNWSLIAKETQDRVLKIILKENDVDKALTYVQKVVDKIRNGEIENEKMVIKVQLSRPLDNYTSIGPHVAVARKMKERGNAVVPGMVVPFIVGK
ncbi:MAG: DNA polymerase domain-containing protein, partial [Candidatus Woesearchaeota archaeon]